MARASSSASGLPRLATSAIVFTPLFLGVREADVSPEETGEGWPRKNAALASFRTRRYARPPRTMPMDLFDRASEKDTSRAPLAERMRPRTLDEFVGQQPLTGPGHFLRRAIEADKVPSLIFWGPPGSGKTTLARVVAGATGAAFTSISAVMAGVKDIREIVAKAQDRWKLNQQRSILFIDEIHRFNKAQQDALLPHVEKGTLTLIGATTENPSFEVNSALLSRCRVVTLRALEEDELIAVMNRAIEDPRGF